METSVFDRFVAWFPLSLGETWKVTLNDDGAVSILSQLVGLPRFDATLSGTIFDGDVWTLSLNGTPFEHPAGAADTLDTIATALAALIDSDAAYSATATGDTISITTAADTLQISAQIALERFH